MKKAVQAVLVLCIILFPARVLSNSLEKFRTLDNARNRELFLSALQSYFSNRGINVNRSAPEFPVLKSMQVRAALRKDRSSDNLETYMFNIG